MKTTRVVWSALLSAVLFTGCGGGGSAGGSAPGTAASAAPASNATLVPVTFSITVSRAPQSARRAQYISPATQSITGSVTPAGGGSATSAVGNCAPPQTTCSVQLLAPVGLDAFTLSLYDQPNGLGNQLSSGATMLQVVAGDTHDVVVTFNGIPATLQLLVTPATATSGAASNGAVEVIARDASGNIILGPGAFTPPIGLSLSDTTGSVTLAATQLSDPAGPLTTYQYNGSSRIGGGSTVTFTANVPGIPSATAALAFSAAPPTPSPAPTGTPTTPPATPTPLPSILPSPLPTRSPSPTPTGPTAPPGYVLLCSYTLQTGAGTSVTSPCTSVVNFNTGIPTTIDFNFTNGRQGVLNATLSEQVGGATNWQVYTNGFNPVRIIIGAQFSPGRATLVVTDGSGGYYQVAVIGN